MSGCKIKLALYFNPFSEDKLGWIDGGFSFGKNNWWGTDEWLIRPIKTGTQYVTYSVQSIINAYETTGKTGININLCHDIKDIYTEYG